MTWFEGDHCYTKHWSERNVQDRSHIIPLKRILNQCHLLNQTNKNRHKEDEENDSDIEIDVDSFDETTKTISSSSWYCVDQKARMQMNECERHVTVSSKCPTMDHELVWEDLISNKSQWNVIQLKLFNRAVKILQDEKLSRMVYKGNGDELVLRRLSIDRSASRLRSALSSVGWPLKLSQWLHLLLVEKLPVSLLACYLDIVQTLRSMVPALVERMIMPSRDAGTTASERLGIILKRPWDPAVTAVVSNMKQQMNLSHSVLFIVVQCSVMQSSMPVTSRRLRFWNTLLSQIGKVVQASSSTEEVDRLGEKHPWTIHDLTERSLFNVRKCIREMTAKHPNRKIILLGWHTASLINCHACLKEDVSGVICLGFPLYSMFGERGTIDDVLCDITTPIHFVIGDRAMTCRVNDLEEARESTFADSVTSLVVVKGADDWLRVSDQVKRQGAFTQSMADRQILESICEFLRMIFASANDNFSSNINMETSMTRKRAHSSVGRTYSIDDSLSTSKKLKYRDGASPEPMKRHHPHSYGDLTDVSGATNNSQLHGLSFNLQTGSISGLTSLPGSRADHDGRRSRSSSRGQEFAPRSRVGSQDLNGGSRSITIDLTKDPNAQLSSALSKRKSQLLQPTEKQTEDAIAAILGSDSDKAEDAGAQQLPATAVMSPSSNLRFPKPTTEPEVTSIVPTSLPPKLNMESSLTVNLGEMNTASSAFSISTPSMYSPAVTNLLATRKPTPTPASHPLPTAGFARSHSFSVDQSRSFLASRSRREDRETQQATAILEQLTSSLDSGNDGRSPSPEFNTSAAGKKLQGLAANARRHSLDTIGSRGVASNAAKGRSRVYKQKRTATLAATNQNAATGSASGVKTKPSVVRYILTSSGLTGILSSGTAVPSKKGSLPISYTNRPTAFSSQQLSSGSKPRTIPLVLAPGGRKNMANQPSASVRFVTSNKIGASLGAGTKVASSTSTPTPLVDLVLGSAFQSDGKRLNTKVTPSPSGSGSIGTATSILPGPSSRAVIKLDNIGTANLPSSRKHTVTISRPVTGGRSQSEASVVFLPGNTSSSSSTDPTSRKTNLSNAALLARRGEAAVAAGGKLLRIAGHNRSASAGTETGAKPLAPVARTLSNPDQTKVRMPSLLLTKFSAGDAKTASASRTHPPQ